MPKASTDTIRRVFDEEGAYFLEVGPWEEVPGFVELRTLPGKYSADYWQQVNLALSPSHAEELGNALIHAAQEARKTES